MRTKIFLLISALALVGSPLFVPASAVAVGVGKTCGTIAQIPCDAGLWCDLEAGRCGGADISGKCIKVPEICEKNIKYVCGCNKKTYGNDCERQMQKVQKDRDGECK
jgi:hypothetical protein